MDMEQLETIPAKVLLTRTKSSSWFGADYNMNIYRGCNHGCIYCDSMSDCYRNPDFFRVKAKKDALKILRDNLRSKARAGVVATGSMSDPYNSFEAGHRLSRNALELLSAYGFGVAVATKSTLVTRDIDVFNEIREHSPVIIKITITTADENLCKLVEPGAPSAKERFAAIKSLSDAGIYCGVLMMPILPFINDTVENMRELVRLSAANGAKFIYPWFGLTLRDSQRAYFYQRLDEHFPGLRARYESRYGGTYSCDSPASKKLYAAFKRECAEAGLLHDMRDIISGYKMGYEPSQFSFFDD